MDNKIAVHTRINREHDRKLEEIARKNYVSKSSVIRWAIVLYLEGKLNDKN